MPRTYLLEKSCRLVLHPGDDAMHAILRQLGFESIPAFPQLLFIDLTKGRLEQILESIDARISVTSQAHARYVIVPTPSTREEGAWSFVPQLLLMDLLQAQPLNTLMQSMKDAWFLHVLLQQQLFFVYQPIFDLQSGQVFAHECLARAQNDQGVIFSGQQLIDAACSTNLAHEFDHLARTTCISAISEIGPEETFFINVLPKTLLHHPQVFEEHFQAILALGLRPQQIVWELTEIQAVPQDSQLKQVIEYIRSLGFGIAIDDLWSTVALDHYVTDVRPDLVKLDRQLINGCSLHPVKQVLIKALVDASHTMGIKVVAEGLETVEDISFCQQLGVDLGQGYGLARPRCELHSQCFA
ncbi:hypothetical protein DO97_14705 [Neosynechococcus sphagnicola sy1]|uniref:EAL domain-containing protein n=1 Tax=Neosynechococcus sphagnicola sy1 TaxID=1497020 RepID=A0A098TIM5_9CYAN|nr:EAL domain-containing protein [Neosynechococcus sphagnicola]KGF71881.1 hypothetical protein DO97_14705 [Neosynechococcus sphagnicola sy1]